MRRFYPADYHCHQSKQPSRRFVTMERHRLPSSKGRRLLDFGCGAGAFLLRMRERGWDVAGVESAVSVANRLRAEHGLHVHTGPLAQAGSFDAITMRQSLEHVHDPLDVGICDPRWCCCPNGGQLLVSVPNFAGLAAHWFGRARLVRPWTCRAHLTHFTPATLRAMLTTAGFANVRIRHERVAPELDSSFPHTGEVRAC